jgi:hypothetical protein
VAPAFETIVYNQGGPMLKVGTLDDNAIRGDRHRQGTRTGAHDASGDIQVNTRYGAYDTILQALTCGTWTDNVLGVGITRRSFLCEQHFASGISDKPYAFTPGWVWNKASFQANANGIFTATFGGFGRTTTGAASAIASSTYGDASTSKMFTAFDGTVTAGSSVLANVTAFSLDIDNGLTPRSVVGSKLSLEPDLARCKVSGSLELWFTDNALIDSFRGEAEDSLSFAMTDPDGNALTIALPALLYTAGSPEVSGDGSIPVKMTFEAYFDADTEESITFTRDPAA